VKRSQKQQASSQSATDVRLNQAREDVQKYKSLLQEGAGRRQGDVTSAFLWPPYVIGGPLYFCPVVSIYLSIFFFFLFLA